MELITSPFSFVIFPRLIFVKEEFFCNSSVFLLSYVRNSVILVRCTRQSVMVLWGSQRVPPKETCSDFPETPQVVTRLCTYTLKGVLGTVR